RRERGVEGQARDRERQPARQLDDRREAHEPRRSRRAPRRLAIPRPGEIAISYQPSAISTDMVLDFERFASRHIGPDAEETAAMLKAVGAPSLDALIDQAIPSRIRLKKPLNLPPGQSEHHFLKELRQIASRNQV